MTKDKVEMWLFSFVAGGTAFALVASMAHMLEAFGWANGGIMAWVLAVVTVILNGVFVALWSISRQKVVKRATLVAMVLLFLVEFFGNFGAGGILALEHLPPQMLTLFFDADRLVIIWVGTFLFAGFLPILNFISVYALSETGLRLLEQADQRTQQANEWANVVLQMHEKQHQAQSPTQSQSAS